MRAAMPQAKKEPERSVLNPLDVMVVTRKHLQDTLDDAVRRGRMTRDDATDLLAEIVRRAISAPAERVKRAVTGEDEFPIVGYDDLTAAQIVSQLGELDAAAAAPRARLRAPQRQPQDGAGGARAEVVLVARSHGLGERVELREVLGGQLDVRGRGVLLQPRAALGAGDRHDALVLREQPGERDLRRRRVRAAPPPP